MGTTDKAHVPEGAATLRKINPESQFRRFGMPAFASRGGNPERRRILEGVKRIRDGVDPKPKHLGSGGGFGGVSLVIPEMDMAFVQAMFPEVNSQDATERTKAWQRFAKSPLSEPYRVHKMKRGPQCRSITAR